MSIIRYYLGQLSILVRGGSGENYGSTGSVGSGSRGSVQSNALIKEISLSVLLITFILLQAACIWRVEIGRVVI